ncbi:putrescine hydroxycinnamoyltransferase 2-like [Miscanthus floridulus]|uniref:putrescine hydroxycinnamoyltransferase 2-like n=1 Tax=Miscanthus floridulus TaxID=154761 RepID=UPI003458F9CC
MKKKVVETTLVAPSEEMRRQELWLSNLDLKFPHIYTRVINYYPAGAGFFDPERLRVALAKALVLFYPLAGRLSLGEDGRRRHVDFNSEGVQFVVARADATGAELFEDYQPSPEVMEMFVPALPPEELPCMVALFQVRASL